MGDVVELRDVLEALAERGAGDEEKRALVERLSAAAAAYAVARDAMRYVELVQDTARDVIISVMNSVGGRYCHVPGYFVRVHDVERQTLDVGQFRQAAPRIYSRYLVTQRYQQVSVESDKVGEAQAALRRLKALG